MAQPFVPNMSMLPPTNFGITVRLIVIVRMNFAKIIAAVWGTRSFPRRVWLGGPYGHHIRRILICSRYHSKSSMIKFWRTQNLLQPLPIGIQLATSFVSFSQQWQPTQQKRLRVTQLCYWRFVYRKTRQYINEAHGYRSNAIHSCLLIYGNWTSSLRYICPRRGTVWAQLYCYLTGCTNIW